MEKALRDIVQIQVGFQFRGKVKAEPSGTVPYIQIRDFTEDHRLITDQIERVCGPNITDRYKARRGDVLFLARGQDNFAYAIAEIPDGTIASNFFYILRPRSREILPEYLAWYLNLGTTQATIRSKARQGSYMVMVPKAYLEKLIIDVPSLNTQRNIIRLEEVRNREEELLLGLIGERKKFLDQISLTVSRKDCFRNNGGREKHESDDAA